MQMAAAEIWQRRASEWQQRAACVILSETFMSGLSVINVRLEAVSSIHTMFPFLLFYLCATIFMARKQR